MHDRPERRGTGTFARTVERALEYIGDRQCLADLIGVELATLDHWTSGARLPPDAIFLRVLDLAFPASSPVLAGPRRSGSDHDSSA
jgi:hypothetical protein